jgi:uncharacterized protein (TIGR02598 family)
MRQCIPHHGHTHGMYFPKRALPFVCAQNLKPLSNNRGFSLVEIALALGIMSFSMIALLGLLPLGMTSLRQASNSSTQSQILQYVVGQAQLANFDSYVTSVGTTGWEYLFDEEANPLAASATNWQFKATVTLASNTGLLSHLGSNLSRTLKVQIESKDKFKTTSSVLLVKNN